MYLDKAMVETQKMKDGHAKYFLNALSFLELGNINFDEKKYTQANEQYKKSLVQFQYIKEKSKTINYHYSRSFYNIGNSFVMLNQMDSAELYLNRALKVSAIQNGELNDFIYTALAKVYTENKQYQRAIDSLQNFLQNPKFNHQKLRSEIYGLLAQNYKNLNRTEDYIVYNEKFMKLSDSLQQHNFRAIGTAFNAEQKEADAALAQETSKYNQVIIGAILVVCFFIVIILYLTYKRKKERLIFKQMMADFEAKNEEKNKFETTDLLPEKLMFDAKERHATNSVEIEILSKLEKFEKAKKFNNSKLTIATLAVQLKTNTTYLSEVINTHKGKNFNAYINELRINYICDKIYQNPTYRNYKISYLAEECGFTSHSTFSTVFKSVTGISPSAFLRESTKIEN